MLRAPTQVSWKRSVCAMANFHCEVAAHHPLFPKPHVRRSVGARAEGAWRVWEGLSSGWGTSDLYQTPQKAISVFFVPAR